MKRQITTADCSAKENVKSNVVFGKYEFRYQIIFRNLNKRRFSYSSYCDIFEFKRVNKNINAFLCYVKRMYRVYCKCILLGNLGHINFSKILIFLYCSVKSQSFAIVRGIIEDLIYNFFTYKFFLIDFTILCQTHV